jgi:hypothetical protein
MQYPSRRDEKYIIHENKARIERGDIIPWI